MFFNGHPYRFKKGAQVKAPDALVRALKEQGAVRAAARKKETNDD
nr:MAG TPA: SsDNA-specific exonuclease [Caudoviricetes sp.]